MHKGKDEWLATYTIEACPQEACPQEACQHPHPATCALLRDHSWGRVGVMQVAGDVGGGVAAHLAHPP